MLQRSYPWPDIQTTLKPFGCLLESPASTSFALLSVFFSSNESVEENFCSSLSLASFFLWLFWRSDFRSPTRIRRQCRSTKQLSRSTNVVQALTAVRAPLTLGVVFVMKLLVETNWLSTVPASKFQPIKTRSLNTVDVQKRTLQK